MDPALVGTITCYRCRDSFEDPCTPNDLDHCGFFHEVHPSPTTLGDGSEKHLEKQSTRADQGEPTLTLLYAGIAEARHGDGVVAVHPDSFGVNSGHVREAEPCAEVVGTVGDQNLLAIAIQIQLAAVVTDKHPFRENRLLQHTINPPTQYC